MTGTTGSNHVLPAFTIGVPADWITLDRRSSLFRTATAHMIAMLLATGAFVVAAIVVVVWYLWKRM